jgi:hypothetical protein
MSVALLLPLHPRRLAVLEIASVRGEAASLVRFLFAAGHATGCQSL